MKKDDVQHFKKILKKIQVWEKLIEFTTTCFYELRFSCYFVAKTKYENIEC